MKVAYLVDLLNESWLEGIT